MLVPKSVIPLIGVILFIALAASTIHFLATGANAHQNLQQPCVGLYAEDARGFLRVPAKRNSQSRRNRRADRSSAPSPKQQRRDGPKSSSRKTLVTSIPDNGTRLRIGGDGSLTFKFPGRLDDVRIYNRALSATEIKQLYSAGR
jgi:Concanavalin A-like lectin/glucanases superfamily